MTHTPQRGHDPQVTLLENKAMLEPDLVALACNLSTWELGTGGSPVHSQFGLGHLSQKKSAALLEISTPHGKPKLEASQNL